MLAALIDGLFGCAHNRTTFPLSPKRDELLQRPANSGAYVTCLDCGREFPYDWALMRRGKEERESRRPASGGSPIWQATAKKAAR